MQIDQVLDAIRDADPIVVSEDWAQGRTLYGGITGAILCEFVGQDIEDSRRLRNLEIGFVRPFEAGKPYHIELETLAQGRTATIRAARIIQEDKVRATAKADFVAPFESQVAAQCFIAPGIPEPDQCKQFSRYQVPDFHRNFFQGSLASPAYPFSGEQTTEIGGWVGFKIPPRQLRDAHLVCLIDAWPPAITPRYASRKPLSTLSWSMHFADPVRGTAPDQPVGYYARVNYADSGLSSTHADIWDRQGRLLAKSQQLNLVYG